MLVPLWSVPSRKGKNCSLTQPHYFYPTTSAATTSRIPPKAHINPQERGPQHKHTNNPVRSGTWPTLLALKPIRARYSPAAHFHPVEISALLLLVFSIYSLHLYQSPIQHKELQQGKGVGKIFLYYSGIYIFFNKAHKLHKTMKFFTTKRSKDVPGSRERW